MLGALRTKSPMVALKLNLYVFKSDFIRMLFKIRLIIKIIKLQAVTLTLLCCKHPSHRLRNCPLPITLRQMPKTTSINQKWSNSLLVILN